MKKGLVFCAGMLFAAAALAAAPSVRVEAVQAPAWLERGDNRLPLVAGQEVHSRDRIITGRDARVLLRLPEGSAVKIGAGASVKVDGLGQRDGGVFTAALDVLKGAFRYTSGFFAADRGGRAINVRVATITAGIRGTDLWGSADAERDLVCLLEGSITAVHADGESVTLDQPLAFYAADKGAEPRQAQADPDQVRRWAAETEPRAGAGIARSDGRWQARLATVETEAEALELYDQLRAAGFAARIRPLAAVGAEGAGQYRYELRLLRLASAEEAEAIRRRALAAIDLPGGDAAGAVSR